MKRIANQAGILPVIAIALVSFASGSFGADMVLAKGSFVGKSGHAVSGMVSIVKTGSSVEVRLAPDFKLDSAPGPYLGFGKAGKYVKATQFSKLNKNAGQQTYKVPARIDVSEYDEVYVWCGPFNVPLGVATLSK